MTDLFPATVPAHNPGGTSLRLPPNVHAKAVYGGPDDCYRYLLDWSWGSTLPTLGVGMMNPSCASHLCGDRTLAWVYRWASARWFGRLLVFNANAYRAADQSRLAEVDDPCGPENVRYIREAGCQAEMVILGYGQPKVKAVRDHGPRMARILQGLGVKLHVWGLSKDGVPKHPLYLAANTEAQEWRI